MTSPEIVEVRPLILMSNDDGYSACGLCTLRGELEAFADVVVCAPHENQSASSHSLTLKSVMRLHAVDEKTFVLDGSPADCVYVALHSEDKVLPRKPDMVVSGMNHGPNLGVDVIYSGTVAAAREAAQRGIPAVAVSAAAEANEQRAAQLGAAVVRAVWERWAAGRLAQAPLINVNVPPGDGWELVATKLGRRLYADDVIYRHDPRGKEYLWIGGAEVRHDQTAGTDTRAWDDGFASVTPLTLEQWDASFADLAGELAEIELSQQ